MKYLSLLIALLLTSCATVGPVEVDSDDTIYTVLTALIVAVVFLILKSGIDFFFNILLEKYKNKKKK